MLLVSWFSIRSVFFAVAVVSVLAAIAALLIRPEEIDLRRASGLDGELPLLLMPETKPLEAGRSETARAVGAESFCELGELCVVG